MRRINFGIFFFTLRVWITSVLVAPALYLVIQFYIDSLNRSYPNPINFDPSLYLLMVVIELVISFLIWIVFWALTEAIVYCITNDDLKRWLVFISAMLLTVIPFIVFVGFPMLLHPESEIFIPMLTNIFCIGCGCWFYKLG